MLVYVVMLLGLNNGRTPLSVPAAHMSTGPVGGGGDNMKYALLVGAAFAGGLSYVSKISPSSQDLVTIRSEGSAPLGC